MLNLLRAQIPAAVLPSAVQPSAPDALNPTLLCDLVIDHHAIVAVQPSSANSAASDHRCLDLAGSLVFPSFVDAHVHLDKCHTWGRAPNRSGTFSEALAVLAADKDRWSADDLHRRAGFGLRCAWAHGTRLIRTHVDTGLPWAETSHAVMADLRRQWAGKIILQTVPLCPVQHYSGSDGEKLADLALRHGAIALGGFALMSADLPSQYDRLLAIARERRVALDLHVDENSDPGAECLRLIAEAVLRNDFPYPVTCGHCCSLAVQAPSRQRETLALVKAARLNIISLPLCNLYLQDRRTSGFPRSPSWRGITLIHEFLNLGVPLACASDNVRDAFYAFGDFDMAEVLAQSAKLAHLDTQLDAAVRAVTAAPAEIVGHPEYGRIGPGAPAHLVVFPATSFSTFLSRPSNPRFCIDGESVTTPLPPDFTELIER